MLTRNPEEIKILRQGGKILAEVLQLASKMAKPGVSAYELDQMAESEIRKRGAKPSFKNYSARAGEPSFPSSLCVSIDDEVVHGIAGKDKILQEGDIVGLDLGVEYKGLFTDGAITVPVGKINKTAQRLMDTARRSLDNGLQQVKAGNRIGDVGFAIEQTAVKEGFSVVRELVGHGVGKAVHEDPEVPCFGKKGTGIVLEEGMVLAIEPMINEKSWGVVFADDNWTVLTADGGLSAHFEHTIIVTKNGYEIMTKA